MKQERGMKPLKTVFKNSINIINFIIDTIIKKRPLFLEQHTFFSDETLILVTKHLLKLKNCLRMKHLTINKLQLKT